VRDWLPGDLVERTIKVKGHWRTFYGVLQTVEETPVHDILWMSVPGSKRPEPWVADYCSLLARN
jgi:hypothetical protein